MRSAGPDREAPSGPAARRNRLAPATPKGRRTEAALLDAARRVFAEKGFLNAKISDITRAAGKSSGSFYTYYDGKEELLTALLDRLPPAEPPAHTGDPREAVRSAVRAYWTTYRAHLGEMVGLFQLSMTDPAFAERWRELRAARIRTVLEVIRDAEASGHRLDLDPGILASAIVSMLESFCWVWLAAGGDAGVAPPDDETAIETLSGIWYRALYPGRAS